MVSSMGEYLAVVSVTPIMRMRRMACFKPSRWVAVLKGQPALKDLYKLSHKVRLI
jgi:hypothetical protein